MPAQAQDTGGLGLIQMLMQLGIPAPALAASLMQLIQAQPQPQDVGPADDTPAPTDNYVDEGVPGNAPGTLGAALSGGRQGAAAQAAQALGAPAALGNAAAKAVGVAANVIGVPAGIVSGANTLAGAGVGAARHNLRQAGRRVAPVELNGPRTIPDTPPPDMTFNDPANLSDVGGTSGTPGTATSLGLGPSPTTNLSMDISSPAVPTGNLGNNPAGLGPPGPANGLSMNVPSFDAMFNDPPADITMADVVAAISAAIAAAGGDNDGSDGGPVGTGGAPGSGEGGSTGTGGAPGVGGTGVGEF